MSEVVWCEQMLGDCCKSDLKQSRDWQFPTFSQPAQPWWAASKEGEKGRGGGRHRERGRERMGDEDGRGKQGSPQLGGIPKFSDLPPPPSSPNSKSPHQITFLPHQIFIFSTLLVDKEVKVYSFAKKLCAVQMEV